jgi:hypothetical protein
MPAIIRQSRGAAASRSGPIPPTSQRLTGWLSARDCSVALTTYQAGRIMFFGRKPDGAENGFLSNVLSVATVP